MTEFWNKIKNWFRTTFGRAWTWTKSRYTSVSTFVYPADRKLHPAVRYVGALVLIGLALLGTILYVRSRDGKNDDENNPELAEVYEPSIGTPLAPDTPGNDVKRPGEVNGATTPTPTPTAMAPTTGVNLVAPKTGIDPNEPVACSNASYKFSATLPAGSDVIEKDGSITFLSKTRDRFYTVSVASQDGETLASIESQLKNSPSVKNIRPASFNGIQALQFDSGNGGIVFINKGNIYYLLGNSKYFQTFKTI